jgi:NADH:ubiquinone reductase (H+-translocating)
MNARDRTPLPRIVIIGAGFGGLQAARSLARAPVQITLIDRNNYHLFQPLLYQVATAALSPADVAVPIRSVVRRQRNAEVLLGEVTGVDTEGRTVCVGDCAGAHDVRVPYDYLVVATGAMGSYFGHNAWASFAPGLKSLEDALAIRNRILLAFEAAEQEMAVNPPKASALLTFVIVGGGPTGVELAGAIAEMVRKALAKDFRHIDPTMARVLLIENEPRVLATFPVDLSAHAERKLRVIGVEVCTGTHVEDVSADGVMVTGERLTAGTVIWAAGVHPAAAGHWLGAAVDRAGRVLVRPDLSVPEHAEIFVIGDGASVSQSGAPLPGVASVAMQQGQYVAQLMCARLTGSTQRGPFTYFDKGMLATVGRGYAIANIRGVRLHGFMGWITWLAVHILYLTGIQNRALVLLQWAWAYVTYQLGARLVLSASDALSTRGAASPVIPRQSLASAPSEQTEQVQSERGVP